MYELGVKRKFSAAHQLRGYQGKCEAIHGHTYQVEVCVQVEKLDELGLAMDFKELAEDIGLEEAEYLELIELFMDKGKSDLDEIQSAIAAKDAEAVASLAHSIKGAAVNLGLTDCYEVAKDIEEKARSGVLEGASNSVQILRKNLEEIEALAG